jgi:YebC/PmpR family DNA-binding regulatory protein
VSGHSKWHNIRLKKGKMDAVRGAKFTKLAREIIVAAKSGGGNPDANLRLRLAVQKARENSMPADKIKNAIQRGTGEIEGGNIEELTYEAYGPGGVALILQCATDNKNRTVADIRSILNKAGGRLAENGSVAWMFNPPQGLITVSKDTVDEEKLLEAALEAGAEDVKTEEDVYEIYTAWGDLGSVMDGLAAKSIPVLSHEVTMVTNNPVAVSGAEVGKLLKLMDALEDHDDVQQVFANFDISDAELEAAG